MRAPMPGSCACSWVVYKHMFRRFSVLACISNGVLFLFNLCLQYFTVLCLVGLHTCSVGLQPGCDGLHLLVMPSNLECFAVACNQPTSDDYQPTY